MNVYRLITKGTCEEHLISIAERKMYLDAMVIKKGRLEAQSEIKGDDNEAEFQESLLNAVRFGAKAIFDTAVLLWDHSI